MVNPPVISAPVHRGTATRSTGLTGADQAFISSPGLYPSEGADQATAGFLFIPSEGADQAYSVYGIPSEGADQAFMTPIYPSEGADQAYVGYGIPSEGASL